MAKAILEFDLTDPDDLASHMRAVKSLDLALALWDIDQHLRSKLKYDETLSQEVYDSLDAAREKLYEIMNSRGISLDDLLP